jgi:hypothetical protein
MRLWVWQHARRCTLHSAWFGRFRGGTFDAARFDIDKTVAAEHGAQVTKDTSRLDWLHLLRHFLCHPDEAEGASAESPWWQEAMSGETSDTSHHPIPIKRDEVQRRISEEKSKRKDLEKMYNDLATRAETEWEALVSTEMPF